MYRKHPETMKFADTDFGEPEILERRQNCLRRCPVIVTLKDSHETRVDIQQLLEAGMNVAMLKVTDCTREDRIKLLKKITEAAEHCCVKYGVQNWPIATCVPLKNFVVKTGILENDENFIEIDENSQIILTNDIMESDKCNKTKIFIDNPFLSVDIKVGTEITMASAEIIAICTEIIDEKSIKCVVIKGGRLDNFSNVCARDTKHSRPFITKKDLEILDFVLEYKIDILIMNYVLDGDSVKQVKQYIGDRNRKPILFSGIATIEGLNHIDDIIKESDGIVLSREFLPYELSAANKYRLANIQKWMAAKCFQAGKPLFISGGVFKEALKYGIFTKSQMSDVVNAILDGTSGFIFKTCAPSTDFIVDVLKTLNDISHEVDPLTASKSGFMRILDEIKIPVNAAEATVISCVMAANQLHSRIIVLPTVSGRTVRLLQRMRPSCLILTVSTDIRISRLLATYRGVLSLLYTGEHQHVSWDNTIEDHLNFAIEFAVQRNLVLYGDPYVALRRSTKFSSFCDMIVIDTVAVCMKQLIECYYAEDIQNVSITTIK